MTPTLKTVIYPVKDLTQAKTPYSALLGVEPIMDEPYYVQFNTAHEEVGLDPNGATWNATLKSDKTIKYKSEESVLGYKVGDEIKLSGSDFSRLSEAYFDAVEEKFR